MRTLCAIMAQIVDSYAVLDDRIVDCAAIDSRICPYLDIIADNDTADLRHLDPAHPTVIALPKPSNPVRRRDEKCRACQYALRAPALRSQ